MIDLLLRWLVLSMGVWVAAWVLPGMRIAGFGSAIFVAGVFGALNFLLGWILFGLIGIATLGLGFAFAFLTRWLVNALLLRFADALTSSLSIDRFATALWAALIIALVGTAGEWGIDQLNLGRALASLRF